MRTMMVPEGSRCHRMLAGGLTHTHTHRPAERAGSSLELSSEDRCMSEVQPSCSGHTAEDNSHQDQRPQAAYNCTEAFHIISSHHRK